MKRLLGTLVFAFAAGLVACSGSSSGTTAYPNALPSPTLTPVPSATPTATATPTPGPTVSGVPLPQSTSFTVVSAAGSIANGTFTQTVGAWLTQSGTLASATPSPQPSGVPTPIPILGTGTFTVYYGTYTLSNNQTGTFYAATGSGAAATSAGTIPNFANYYTLAQTSPSGLATVTFTVSGATGSGKISLDNGVTGTVTITSVATITK